MIGETKLILIAEDEEEMRDILTDRFRMADFGVLEASNGADALKQVEKHRPDILLLDILMPELDGVEVVRAVRKHPWGKKIPVIFLTNLEKPPAHFEELSNDDHIEYIVKINTRLEDIVAHAIRMLRL